MLVGRAIDVTLALVLVSYAACVDVNGGAVELSWAIKKADGQPVNDCDAARISRVTLHAVPVAPTTGSELADSWSCDAFHGTTLFNIPAGQYALSITLCDGTGLTQTGRVPAPIVRDITKGDVVELDALLIVTNVNGEACSTPTPTIDAGVPDGPASDAD
jgi:hypothetical protein